MKAKPKTNGKTTQSKIKPSGSADAERQKALEALQESEAKFSAAFHSTPTALVLARISDSKFEYVNESFLMLVGYERDDVIGKTPNELNIFPNPAELAKTREILLETKKIRNVDTTVRSKNGEIRHVLFSVDIIQLNQQPHSLTTMVDITERVHAEKRAVQMKRLYATLSQVNQTIVRVKSQEELYQSICDVALKFGELTFAWIGLLDEVTGDIRPVAVSGLNVAIDKWPFPILNIHRKPSLNRIITDAMHTSNTVTSEDVQTDERAIALRDVVQKFGFHSLAAVPFRLRGETIGILVMISVERGIFKAPEELKLLDEMGLDISFALDTMKTEAEHKQTELLLRQSEQKYSIIFDKSPYAIALNKMPENTIVGANDAFLELFEFTRAEVFGKTSVELGIADAESRAKIGAEFQAHGRLHDFEVTRTSKAGKRLNLALNLDWVTIGEEKYILTTIRNITERKQDEAQIEYQANLLKHINDAVIAVDHQFHITAWNHAAKTMYGWSAEEVLGNLSTNIIRSEMTAEERQEILKQLREHGMYRNEIIQYRKDGQPISVEASTITLHDKDNQVTGLLSVNRDITERKQAEAALRLENERFQRFVESNIVGIIIANDAGKIIMANDYYLKILGVTRQDFADGKVDWRKFTPPEWLPADEKAIQELREQGICEPYEKEYERADGKRVPVYIANAMLPGPEEHIAAFVLDLTELKQAEAALHESGKRIDAIISSAMDAIISIDADQNILMLNAAAEQMFQCRATEVIGESLERFIPERFHAAHRRHIEQFGRDGATNRTMGHLTDLSGVRADGEEFPIEASISQVTVRGEKVFTAILRDVTERKRAEEKIQRQLEHLNSLRMIDTAIGSSFDIHVTLDIVLQQVLSQLGVDAAAILLLNPQLQTIEYAASRGFRSNVLQHTQLQLNEGYAGRAVHERKTIYIPALLEADGKLAEVLRLAHEDFVDYYGTPLVSKDGIRGVLEVYHRSTLHPAPEWLDFLGTLAGQAAIAIDNALLFDNLQRANAELEQRVAQRTEELKKTNIELEHANRTKDEFLATMSHELRTPLNSILGLSETLLEQRRDPLSEFQQRYLQTIASSGNHLLELINDILDLSKIEAGRFDHHPQLVGVNDLCQSSLTFVKELATRKSITLTYQQETTVSKMYADPRRLKQILINLLTNAVKFTPEHGRVILQVATDAEQERIQFSVIDNGIGIAPENLKKLFQPFVQIDSSLTRQYEGTGLGLTLVQKLTDLHGGSVNVESDGVPGKGCRFTVNLPLRQAMPDQPPMQTSDNKLAVSEQLEKNITSTFTFQPANRAVVLLAEDNMANILTIGDYLESHGYQVVAAHDGLDAIDKAEALQPNLILMDIQMPVLNGLEAISRLRADHRFATTPIIALTALAMPGDRERCLVAGANEYMSKPVSLKVLIKTIEALLKL